MSQVLLIEGHRLLREAIVDLLVQSGYGQVAQAADPIDAIGQIARVSPQIIIVDTTWDGINGVWLGRLLRQLVPLSKIVLLVDDGWLGNAQATHSECADALVSKNGLMAMLPAVLARWQFADSKNP